MGKDVVVKGQLDSRNSAFRQAASGASEAAGVRFGKIYGCCTDHKRIETLQQTRGGVSISFSTLV